MRRIHTHYLSGGFGPLDHEVYPDIDRSSRENYLFFTLPVSVNFQRNSEQLWRAALATFQDSSVRFVFDPSLVARADQASVADALIRYRLALQTNRHVSIWRRLSDTLATHFSSHPREVLRTCDFDVVATLDYLRTRKQQFPCLNGMKMSNYWLYMLSRFTDVALRGVEHISVIPDTHVIRSSVILGLLPEHAATPYAVAAVWTDLLRGTDLRPMDVHAPLWRWSRSGFCPSFAEDTV